MNYKEQVKQIVEEKGYIDVNHFGSGNERYVRDVISKLRKEGFLIIPKDKNRLYYHVDHVERETICEFAFQELKAEKTKRENTINPIMSYLDDSERERLMGRLVEAWNTY